MNVHTAGSAKWTASAWSVAVLLVGCSGWQSAAMPAFTQPSRPAATGTATFYATGTSGGRSSVNIFAIPGYKQTGSITDGISRFPGSLWVDKNGNLYVSNSGDVTEYRPGGHAPMCSYRVANAPHYVTTDGKDDVFITSTGPGYDPHTSYVTGFKQCGARIRQYELPGEQPFVYAAGIAIDADSNIFVAVGTGFVEFAKGSSTPTPLGAKVSGLPGALLIDSNKNLIAADNVLNTQTSAIYTVPPPYGSARVLVKGKSPVNLALDQSETVLYAANASKSYVAAYDYPSGKLERRLTIPTQWRPGIAISPDAPLWRRNHGG